MKVHHLPVAAAACALALWPFSTAFAQLNAPVRLAPTRVAASTSAQQVGFRAADDCVCAPSCVCADECAPACCDNGCGDGCDEGCGNGCDDACEPACPTLQSILQGLTGRENKSGIVYGGWIQGGYTFNNHGNYSATGNFPVPFNYVSDSPLLNQLWGFVAKPVDTSEKDFDIGFRLDYVFGSDARFTQAFGDNGWDATWDTGRDYGSAIPQIYGEVAYRDVSVKVGHFYSIIGYEVVQAPSNFFYSRAYTFQYGEPFTHTGALGTWNITDKITLYGGYTFGWDSGFENGADAHTYLGGVSYKFNEEGTTTLTWTFNVGDYGDGTDVNNNPIYSNGDIAMHSIVFQTALTDKLTYVFQHDYGTNYVGPQGAAPADNFQWYGVNQYAYYQLTEKLRLGARLEWFRDNDGARVNAAAGAANYYAATFGVNWSPLCMMTVRPEVRFDWADAAAFNNNNDFYLTTFGIDAYFKF